MAEPVAPRSRAAEPPKTPHDVWAQASLANLRQIAIVLFSLAALFLAGWAGLLLAGARPVGWGRVLMIVTVAIALGMLVEGVRRIHQVRSVLRLLRVTTWETVDAHWVGRRSFGVRKMVVLHEFGVVRLLVKEPTRAAERAVEERRTVWMLRPTPNGRSAVLIEHVAQVFPARVGH